ncbi:recombinase family protein [Candidatus Gottesmanbacteria bacterium]|nr:recombinase family protein [Candidatus Gottesmanbacteria bacterium]
MNIVQQNHVQQYAPQFAQLRAVIYPRVSKDEQNAPGKASNETQTKEMTEEAIKRGWKIVHTANEDCEGWVEFRKRPDGGTIMEMADNDKFDILMLWDNDRLGRDVDGIVAKIARRDFRRRGIQTFSLHQPGEIKPRELYEPYSEDSSLWVENASDTASSLYIRQFKRRHDMGMRKRIENGKITGTPPIGYKVIVINDPPKSTIWRQKRVEDEEYSPIIRQIFDDYEKGLSFVDIVKKLNIKGVKTPSRYAKDGKVLINGDRLWTATTIKGIINNPTYYGASVYYKDKSVSIWDETSSEYVTVRRHQPMDKWLVVDNAEHPALIKKEQWLRCQEIKKSKANYGRTYGESYLLSGLCRCGHCRYGMHRSGGWGGGYVECDRHLKTGKTQCQTNSHRILHLEKYVMDYISDMSKNPNVLPLLKIKKVKKEQRNLDKELIALELKLKTSERIKEKIHEFMENGTYSPEVGTERLEKQKTQYASLLARIKEVKDEALQLLKQQRVNETAIQVLQNFEERFKKLPLKHQKVMLRSLVKEILLYTDKETKERHIEIVFNLD